MIIFIDESGIHKQSGHSTASVVYVEVKDVEKFEKSLKKIEAELKINFFHWAEERWLMKNKFLSRVFELDFTFKIAIFDNPVKQDTILEAVFQHLIVERKVTKIYVDGEKPKWYERKLKKVLRDKGITTKKLKTVRSKSEVGIQLADALASLARYNYDYPEEKDAKKWFNKFKKEGKLSLELFVNLPQKTSPKR